MAEASQWNRPKKDANGANGGRGATALPKGGSAYANRRGRPFARGLLAAIIVVIGASLAFYFICGQDGAPGTSRPTAQHPAEKKRGKIAETTPAKVTKPAAEKAAAKKPSNAPTSRPILGKTPTGEEYVAMTAKTNDDGVVTERYQLPDGSWKRVVQLQRKETMVFDNDFDLALSLIATTPMDQELPPMPDMGDDLEAVFKKAIESPIVIKETDSDRVKEMKQGAQQIRLEIADLMAEGYSIKQILNEHNGLRQANVEIRREFQSELNDIYRSGDYDGARKYLETMNKALDEKGILPLVMPGSTESPKRRSK